MARRVPRKSIFVTWFTANDAVIRINQTQEGKLPSLELEVSVACQMSTTPSRNSGQVVIRNLSERHRNLIAGVTSQLIDYTNASLAPGSDGFIPLVGGNIITGTSVVPGGFAKEETINNGDGYVEVNAGEDFAVGRMFEGSSKKASHRHEGPDWFTTIDIIDGGSTLTGGHTNDRFPPGASMFSVIRHLIRSMGLGSGNLTPTQVMAAFNTNAESVFPIGFITAGNPQAILTRILTSTGAEWFVDRGEFYLVRKGEPLPGKVADVDEKSGLIDRPVPLENGGVGISTKFRKDIRVGRKVRLQSSQLSGEYRCEVVSHRINNFTGDWSSTAILRSGVASGLF